MWLRLVHLTHKVLLTLLRRIFIILTVIMESVDDLIVTSQPHFPWYSYFHYLSCYLLLSSHYMGLYRKYPPFPLLSYFPWLCAWDVCYIIFCHMLHIHSGITGILFSSLLRSVWWVQIVGYVLACRSRSFVCTSHHLIIIIVQTYLKTLNLKCPSDIFYRVCEWD